MYCENVMLVMIARSTAWQVNIFLLQIFFSDFIRKVILFEIFVTEMRILDAGLLCN
jgi:hypothetical protein